jgi:hypothetical protein
MRSYTILENCSNSVILFDYQKLETMCLFLPQFASARPSGLNRKNDADVRPRVFLRCGKEIYFLVREEYMEVVRHGEEEELNDL